MTGIGVHGTDSVPRYSGLEVFVLMPQDECVERLLKYVCSAGAIDESVWIPDKPLPQGTGKNLTRCSS
jgi:hypothetical protein